MNIYDTEDPYRLVPIADAVIAVFSTASRESFDRLQPFSTFFAEFQENGGLICFVGTHTDIDSPPCGRSGHTGWLQWEGASVCERRGVESGTDRLKGELTVKVLNNVRPLRVSFCNLPF